ncbi:MAG TPA: hypothetical protein PLI27_01795 [Ignavibacteriales bacterium]|nr:hypothetical protein [Ignavibacteriales bacterium]HOL80933.1 hypothetical protein [Ignavibacteriales bacterium]HOM64669.1 hypothetical protein [Ignavibacteriales bacterium]HPD66800.1 hypothetical protein [Ignavibacteriales bacterium]HPP32714.1 hypothetical protein [Ignavibacteriales bacterium]
MLSHFIDKYKLQDNISYILNENIENIIIKISDEKYIGTKLGYELAEANNLMHRFTPEYFVKKLLKYEYHRPTITLALNIVFRYDFKNFDTSLFELSQKLRFFTFEGVVIAIKDYGCFVRPYSIFKIKNPFFYIKTI